VHSHSTWMAVLLGLWRMVMDYGTGQRVLSHDLVVHHPLAIFTDMLGDAVVRIVGIIVGNHR
jgi:hypothetical protein